MSRFRNWIGFWVAGLLLSVGEPSAQAGRPSEDLLPDTTVGFAAITNVDDLAASWKKTQLGQLMADPVMEPFTEDLGRQFEQRWSGVHERLGLTLEDLRGVPGGEVGLASILRTTVAEAAEQRASVAILVDVTGHVPQATALLEKVSENLKKQGASRSEKRVPESPDLVVQFDDVPPPKNLPEAGPGTAFYHLSGNLLLASDNLEVIRGILARVALPAGQGNSLAAAPGFKSVMGRCERDPGGAKAQIRWFIDPLGYAGAVRAATPEKHRRKGKSVVEILRNQGFGAVRGVGGHVDFHVSDKYQLVHRTAVYAPRRDQYEKSMRMLVFPNETQFDPQRWVPDDVATYTTFYVDILNAFDNFGPLVDEMFEGQDNLFDAESVHQADLDKGVLPKEFIQKFEEIDITISPQVKVVTKEAGSVWEIKDNDETYTVKKVGGNLKVYGAMHLWEDILQGLKVDSGIDLRGELIKHLGKRVTVITAYDEPITTTSERLLFAIETINEEAVAAAIEKTMKTNTGVKLHQYEGHVIWEIVEEEQPGEPQIPTLHIPSLTGGDVEGQDDGRKEDEKDSRLLPHAAVTVAQRHLFVASHLDFLKKVLKAREERNMLGANVDLKLVREAVEELGIERKCAWSFSRTDEEYRPTYELIRQGKMPQSETMLARVLNAVFSTGKKGEFRSQKIDGSQMPDYDVVRRYLGPGGLAVTSEQDGWFFKGFTLKK